MRVLPLRYVINLYTRGGVDRVVKPVGKPTDLVVRYNTKSVANHRVSSGDKYKIPDPFSSLFSKKKDLFPAY